MKKLSLFLGLLLTLAGCPACPPGTPPGHPGRLCIPADTTPDMGSPAPMCCVPCLTDADCVSSFCPTAKDYGKCMIIGVRTVGTCVYP